jgi:hypothetical protein
MEISDEDAARTEDAVGDRGSGDPHPFARRRLGDASATPLRRSDTVNAMLPSEKKVV